MDLLGRPFLVDDRPEYLAVERVHGGSFLWRRAFLRADCNYAGLAAMKLPTTLLLHVSSVGLLALVGLTLFHAGDDGWINAGFVEATQPATDDPAATSGFLHAPTSDPSLPSLEATRFPDDVTPAAEAAPASTF